MGDPLVDDTATQSLELFTVRLRRLEYYLNGVRLQAETEEREAVQSKDQSIPARIAGLQNGLEKLSVKSRTVRDVLDLYEEHEDIFTPLSPAESQTSLSTSEKLVVVQSCATSYPTAASRLNSIQDQPIPPAKSSASMIALRPDLVRIQLLQESQAKEISTLRQRTAQVIQRWYEIGVLGEGECWVEWEDRVGAVERSVRRSEGIRAQEAAEI